MLVNSKKMLEEAKQGHYAVAHFNINNLEWTKYILEEMENLKKPVILGVSEGAAKYMGGWIVVSTLVRALMKELNTTIDVCLHVDHGTSLETCKQAIDAGFTSVMIDASKFPFEENVKLTREVVAYAHPKGVTVEAELGHIGGSEDGVSSAEKCFARLEECIELEKRTGIDSLAPALGSVHGLYQGEPNLDFETMKKISDALPIPLVLHGGTGIPEEQIQRAIDCGISKININTELQIAWHEQVKKFIETSPDSYDPRRVIGSGKDAVKEKIREKVKLFMERDTSTSL